MHGCRGGCWWSRLLVRRSARPWFRCSAGPSPPRTSGRAADRAARWHFIIWNVIIALSIGYAIWAESDQRPNLALRNRLTGRFLSPASASRSGSWPRARAPLVYLVVFLIMLAGLLPR